MLRALNISTGGSGVFGDLRKLTAMEDKPKALRIACRDFEAIFLGYMMKEMRKTVSENGILGGGGLGAGFFQEMFDMEVAWFAAERRGFGLSRKLYQQLSALLPEESRAGDGEKPSHVAPGLKRLPVSVRSPAGKGKKTPAITKEKAGRTGTKNDDDIMRRLGGRIGDRLKRFEKIIEDTARAHKVDPDLVKAIIVQESGARPDSVSTKGAKGLMQLMEGTARDMGVIDLFDPEQNIKGGVRYLSWLFKRFSGDEKLVLASYNAGPGRVAKYRGVPPFPETRRYVDNVLAIREAFKRGKNVDSNHPIDKAR